MSITWDDLYAYQWDQFTTDNWNNLLADHVVVDCERNKRKLPKAWRQRLRDSYEKAPSRNAWADYNCTAEAYLEWQKGIRPFGHSVFCEDDAPEFPDTSRFTDLEKPRDCSRD